MSGYVGQRKCYGKDPNGIQFLLSRETGLEKKFVSREACILFLRKKMHYALDDLRFFFWFEDGEDKPRYLLKGELINPEPVDTTEIQDDLINDEEIMEGGTQLQI